MILGVSPPVFGAGTEMPVESCRKNNRPRLGRSGQGMSSTPQDAPAPSAEAGSFFFFFLAHHRHRQGCTSCGLDQGGRRDRKVVSPAPCQAHQHLLPLLGSAAERWNSWRCRCAFRSNQATLATCLSVASSGLRRRIVPAGIRDGRCKGKVRCVVTRQIGP